jgi:drug/metabolite transporter (DMT)-like permease
MGLKYGDLSTLYPFIALSYVWTFLFSVIFFKENSHALKIIGCVLIILGVSLLGMKGNAAKNKENMNKDKSSSKYRNKTTGKTRGAQ